MIAIIGIGSVEASNQKGNLKVQAQTLYYGEEGQDLTTEWMKVEILKQAHDYSAFEETFENYTIENGWIDVELGTQEDNKIDPEIFDTKINWIKITIKDKYGIPDPIIITMNAIANSLFSYVARETPTGNLFPSIKERKNQLVIINPSGNKFEYISTENLVELIQLENKEKINKFFKVERGKDDELVIVEEGDYSYITMQALFNKLELEKFFGDQEIPDIKTYEGYSYLRTNRDSDGLEYAPVLQSYTDAATEATANLFVGQGSESNPIFLWNSEIQRFEVQPTESLGFGAADELIKLQIELIINQ